MFPDFKNMPYEARLEERGLWSLKERRNRADIMEVFKTVKQLSSVACNRSFRRAEDSLTQGHSWKLVKENCCCDCRLHFSASDQPLEQLVPGGYRRSYSQQLQESFGEEKKTSAAQEC